MVADLLSTLPIIFSMINELLDSGYVNQQVQTFIDITLVLFLFKFKNIIRILNKLSEQYALRAKTIFLINIMKLFGFVIIMGHIFASVWLFIGNL